MNPGAVHVGEGVVIRRGCFLRAHRGPGLRIRIGDGSSLNERCRISAAEEVTIGRHVMVAAEVFIVDHDHVFDHPDLPPALVREVRSRPVRIDDGCWLGFRSIVLKGVRVGRRSVVGAGAVVTRDVPPESLAVGVPARVVARRDPRSGKWVKVAGGRDGPGDGVSPGRLDKAGPGR
ncbi:acyltransferase [Dissulfurirhabdus thermomarina]|uniref:Acyltransferase n=1 Tax=Dissulfurirhabdus thermomarina TaxID=1765737 RepID=A0A6N9TM19_DISTH|nr:acyltransferase [Dissulfurirhabdus thermomarina]NDY42285.1 acyltransferase [Dissulfurirhabdus thermomarina]NMX23037.1 acyltransferase [Dissulfurirhabdus thermomarina]